MSGETQKFEQWCLVEVMGHQSYAGFVTEQSLGGTSFVRVDVPATANLGGFTKLFGAGSIYCITPVEESAARAMAQRYQQKPIDPFQFHAVERKVLCLEEPQPVPTLDDDVDFDDDDDDDDLPY